MLDLKANPSFGELQEIRAFCSRYLDEDGLSSKEDEDDTDEGDILPEGLTRDHFKDQEMADRAGAWAKEFDGIMTFLEAASKGKTAPYPRKTPRFEGPKELISYFKARWEKLKCRYC